MRIGDLLSNVCSSELLIAGSVAAPRPPPSNIGTVTYAIGGEPQAAAAAATATTVGSESDTPAFPWPPPRATVRTVLDRDMTFGGAANLGAVAERLSEIGRAHV